MRLNLVLSAALGLIVLLPAGCGSDSESPASGEPSAAKWSYEGNAGPDHWAQLDDEYALCEDGHRQSPVDLTNARQASFPKITTHYVPERLEVEDNGHAIEADVDDPQSWISIGGVRYELDQFHVHMPSEETVDGKHFPAIIHLVNVSDNDRIAVIAVFARPGAANPAFDFKVPDGAGETTEVAGKIDPDSLLPMSDLAYRYQGSLTTPPCTEGVTWTVFKEPITLSPAQLNSIGSVHNENNRPIQPRDNRKILLGPALAD